MNIYNPKRAYSGRVTLVFTLVLLFFIGGIILHILDHRPIRDRVTEIGQTAQIVSGQTVFGIDINALPDDWLFFETIEEAIHAYFIPDLQSITSIPDAENEIVRFADDAYLMLMFVSENWRGESYVSIFQFVLDEGKISFPIYSWGQGIESCASTPRGRFSNEDRIARDIVWSYTKEHITERANGGIPIYYGVGIGKPPISISIFGYEPNRIIPFSYEGEDFFFWYYLHVTFFGEMLKENIDISRVITGEIIELFDIQIER